MAFGSSPYRKQPPWLGTQHCREGYRSRPAQSDRLSRVFGNLIPCLVLLIVLPIIFRALQPTESHTIVADPDRLRQEDQQIHTKEREDTFGSILDNAWILNLSLVVFGVFALISEWRRTGFALDLNSVIVMLVLGGLLLHWRPSAYIGAVKHAARISGSLILQYPLYGGLMGIITTTGRLASFRGRSL